MATSAAHDFSRLTADEARRLPGLTASVLASATGVEPLLRALEALDHEQRPALAAALFESVGWRMDVRHYWVYFRMARVYAALGSARDDACYMMAAMAAQILPDWPATCQMFADLFAILRRRGHARAACEVFFRAIELTPEHPPAEPHDIAPLLEEAGLTLPDIDCPPPADAGRRDHQVVPADERPPWTCPVFGGGTPYCLHELASPMRRPPIDVAEFADADVLLCNGTVVVLDRRGAVHGDVSVSNYPHAVRRKLERMAHGEQPPEMYDVEEAVVISDRFPPPNLCHFLLDQVTRLALYQRAGVATGTVTVIGPQPVSEFQRRILQRAGVSQLIDSARFARVRARRLWISSSCRNLQHAGDRGAPWAVEFARMTLGGRGERGWRRLYVSRGDVAARNVVNEADVIALLEPHGFEVIQPGRMPYEAQLAAFRHASHVIAPHGAALAHMIVCPEGAHVLEMFHPLYGTSAFAMQAAAAGVRYAAMVARDALSDAPEWNDPGLRDVEGGAFLARHMRVDLDALRDYLATVV